MQRPQTKLESNSIAGHRTGHGNSNSKRSIAGSTGHVAPRRAATRRTSSSLTPATERRYCQSQAANTPDRRPLSANAEK
eukprot:5407228-Alexandrium_andersonii.AAC.1